MDNFLTVPKRDDATIKREDARLKDLATRGDIAEVRLEMKSMEMRLLKWQTGIGVTLVLPGVGLAGIMAKGFGWPGF